MQTQAHPSGYLIPSLHRLAYSVADKRGRSDARAQDLRHELAEESQSAASLRLASIFDRASRLRALAPNVSPDAFFVRLASLAQSEAEGETVDGRGVSTLSAFPLSVWRSAHKACDKALRKMAREANGGGWRESIKRWRSAARALEIAGNAHEAARLRRKANDLETDNFTPIFDAGAKLSVPVFASSPWSNPWHARDAREELPDGAPIDPTEGVAAALACTKIRLRAQAIRDAIRETVADHGTQGAAKSGGAFLRWIDAAETRCLQLATGENGKALSVLASKGDGARSVVETLAIFDGAGRPVAHDGRGSVTGSRKRKDYAQSQPYAAAFYRLRKLEMFLGRSVCCV